MELARTCDPAWMEGEEKTVNSKTFFHPRRDRPASPRAMQGRGKSPPPRRTQVLCLRGGESPAGVGPQFAGLPQMRLPTPPIGAY